MLPIQSTLLTSTAMAVRMLLLQKRENDRIVLRAFIIHLSSTLPRVTGIHAVNSCWNANDSEFSLATVDFTGMEEAR